MKDCLFCKLVHKQIPALVVYETDQTIAFLELMPSAPGHTMVIHKNHGRSIQDYSQQELGEVMQSVQVVSHKIESALHTDSITIGINHKEQQGVPHLHVHLIPRWEKDKGHVIQGVVHHSSEQSREEIASLLRDVA